MVRFWSKFYIHTFWVSSLLPLCLAYEYFLRKDDEELEGLSKVMRSMSIAPDDRKDESAGRDPSRQEQQPPRVHGHQQQRQEGQESATPSMKTTEEGDLIGREIEESEKMGVVGSDGGNCTNARSRSKPKSKSKITPTLERLRQFPLPVKYRVVDRRGLALRLKPDARAR